MNNVGKCREIFSRLNNMRLTIEILMETKVKQAKTINIRNKTGNTWRFHDNGRVWMFWDVNKVKVEFVSCTDQLVHARVIHTNGEFRS